MILQKRKKIVANFEIKTQSKITRLIAPFYDEKNKNESNSSYKVAYGSDYKSAKIEFTKSQEDIINYNNEYNKEESSSFNSTFCVLFRAENMDKTLLCIQ